MLSIPLLKIVTVLAWLVITVGALYEDDVGVIDFKVSTTGHGPINYAAIVPLLNGSTKFATGSSVLITSDSEANPWRSEGKAESSDSSSTSCYIAGRNLTSGSLLWRRNVCHQLRHLPQRHISLAVTTPRRSLVVTATSSEPIIRAFDAQNGAELWEIDYNYLFKGHSFPRLWSFSIDHGSKNESSYVAVGNQRNGASAVMTVIDVLTGSEVNGSDLTRAAGKALPAQSSHEGTSSCKEYGMSISIAADVDSASLSFGLNVLYKGHQVELSYAHESPFLLSAQDEPLAGISTLLCSSSHAYLLLTTSRGTTTAIDIEFNSARAAFASILWQTHEALATINAVNMIDTSHNREVEGFFQSTDNDVKSRKLQSGILSFKARLLLQYHALNRPFQFLARPPSNSLTQTDLSPNRFGFQKIAILLSSDNGQVFGMPTAGAHKGNVTYKINLPIHSKWHRLVHGNPNSLNAAHGFHADTHSRDVLVLSAKQESSESDSHVIHWVCFDGVTGKISERSSVKLSIPVIQVIPLRANGDTPCQQSALLLLQDKSTVQLHGASTSLPFSLNGFFAHAIKDSSSAGLESFRISEDVDGFAASPLGAARFPGEKIVTIGYPRRDELIRSPCQVIGDDSLLLKYLNPHLAVVITTSSNTENLYNNKTKLLPLAFSATGSTGLAASSLSTRQKQKPTGVQSSLTDSSATATAYPSLLVNVVDTVTGRLYYREAHRDVGLQPSPQLLVSENWIFYTFANQRTRRFELGVLSLYEGMINSKALTAFSGPLQQASFSSIDARNSMPVVLSKTYMLSDPVVALGATTSRCGISGRKLLLATASGQLASLDRKLVGTLLLQIFCDNVSAPLFSKC
jgi:hypothetical protein